MVGTAAERTPPEQPRARRTPAATGRAGLGRYGEDLAARYLGDRGYAVIDRNWRCAHGEIDIVATRGGCLVVCEVKTRTGTGFGDPVEAVTVAKVLRLRRLAATYVRERDLHPSHLRIDVVGILVRDGRPASVRHVEGVGG